MGENGPQERSWRYIRLLRDDIPIIIAGRVAAGEPILANEHVMGRFPRTLEEAFRPRADYFLRCEGDSVNLCSYVDGTLVAVRSQLVAENDEVVIAGLDDDVTLKGFVQKDRWSVEFGPESTNPRHQPIRLDLKHRALETAGTAAGALIGDGFGRPEYESGSA